MILLKALEKVNCDGTGIPNLKSFQEMEEYSYSPMKTLVKLQIHVLLSYPSAVRTMACFINFLIPACYSLEIKSLSFIANFSHKSKSHTWSWPGNEFSGKITCLLPCSIRIASQLIKLSAHSTPTSEQDLFFTFSLY